MTFEAILDGADRGADAAVAADGRRCRDRGGPAAGDVRAGLAVRAAGCGGAGGAGVAAPDGDEPRAGRAAAAQAARARAAARGARPTRRGGPRDPRLAEALATLTAHQRLVLLLRFEAGLSLREVGELLDINEDAARKRVARARTLFLDAYAAAGADDPRPTILLLLGREDPAPYVAWLEAQGARVRTLDGTQAGLDLAGADGAAARRLGDRRAPVALRRGDRPAHRARPTSRATCATSARCATRCPPTCRSSASAAARSC